MKPQFSRRMFAMALFLTLLAATLPLFAQQPAGRIVYEVTSQYQRITVFDTVNGYRQLGFDFKFDGRDSIQSEMNKAKPTELTLAYSRHMMTSLPVVAKPNRILVVGLGGACIPRYLRVLLPDALIDSVELDPKVVEVAQRFFYYVEDDHQKVHVGDGRKFIEQSKDKYDLIILDAFSATSIPYLLATKEFLQLCKDHLTEGGVVSANLWYEADEYHDMLKTYATVFPEWKVMRCPRSTNAILLALPSKRDLSPEKWMELATNFEKKHPTGLNLPQMIDKAIEPVSRVPMDAKVLLDADAGKHK